MSDTKYLIPECGFKAALENIPKFNIAGLEEEIIKQALQDFVRWLSDNPIVPSYDDMEYMSHRVLQGSIAREDKKIARIIVDNCCEWQRRMFLAPEPERDWKTEITNSFREVFPVEEGYISPPFRDSNQSVAEVDARISDLLFNSPTHVTIQVAEDRIRRAFRRGYHEGFK